MKKLSILLVAAIAMAMLLPSFVFAGGPDVYPLMAGQNIEVGTVTVSDDGTNLTVAYETEAGWFIVQAHLYADVKAPKNGAPGRFPFNSGPVHDTSYTFTVPLADLGVASGDELLYIAAHAVVNNENNIIGYDVPTMDEVNAALPGGTVDMSVAHPGGDSYFNTTISGGSTLDGTYDGFCVDTSRNISPGAHYQADVISSYDAAAAGLVDFPENLDLVNWIINQGFVGQASPSGGTYTYSDVQRAIWTLIDDTNSTAGLGPWTQARVDEIVAAALANGEGFVPSECGDVVAVLLNPINIDGTTGAQITIAQVTFVELGLECTPIYQSETGWAVADSGTYFRNGWGSYFTYEL